MTVYIVVVGKIKMTKIIFSSHFKNALLRQLDDC